MQSIINIQEVNTEIIDEVSLGIYQQDIYLHNSTIFGQPFRDKSNIICLSDFSDYDIFDSSITRLQSHLIDLVESEEIFHFCEAKIHPQHYRKYKKYLIGEILHSAPKSKAIFLSKLDFYYLTGILGYDCK